MAGGKATALIRLPLPFQFRRFEHHVVRQGKIWHARLHRAARGAKPVRAALLSHFPLRARHHFARRDLLARVPGHHHALRACAARAGLRIGLICSSHKLLIAMHSLVQLIVANI